jgi:hypothetical protein
MFLNLLSKAGFRRASFLWQVFMWQVLFPNCTCVCATNFICQVFMWQVLFTGVNVSEKGVYRRHDRKIIIVRWPITSNVQITWQVFFVDPYRRTKFVLWQFFLCMTSALVQKLACYSFWTSALVIVQILFVCMGQQRKLVKVIRAFDVIGQLATNKLSE